MSGEPKLITVADDGGETLEFMQLKNGLRQPPFNMTADEIQEIFEHVPETPCRDDDIMLATFPKTGTNWLYEMLSMIQRRSSARVQDTKMSTMLEANKADVIDTRSSPRVLNSHYRPRFLPKDLCRKQIKTVLCLRNPKDAAVSQYAHMTGMHIYNYKGTFTDWIRPYVEGEMEYNSYADYLNAWQEVIEAGPGYPLHVMYFEDLKMKVIEAGPRYFIHVMDFENLKKRATGCYIGGIEVLATSNLLEEPENGEYGPFSAYLYELQKVIEAGPRYSIHVMDFENLKMDGIGQLNKLLKFLGVDLDEATRDAIFEQCHFPNMLREKPEIMPTVEHFKNNNLFRKGHSFYRKGEVGDWKNWFTVAKNEMFDAVWASKIRPDTMFHFRYLL
ncbi:sulfotransferase 1B1-like [Mya arenaria]|uniref:sulfotransferase 1B1-like n=1 Tax=Mya arenaria TaxID=6604 RepID=UPI0022DF3E2E|nr:sulfotransferase 1B1-like [Mya arenaria]